MATPEIEEFAEVLVQQVRDAAIWSCDQNFRPDVTHLIARRWRDASNSKPEAFAKALIPDIVDDVIAELFRAIDQELLRLSFTGSSGKTVDLVADGLGELEGWFMGDWRTKYSKERVADDFSDLKHFFDKDCGTE